MGGAMRPIRAIVGCEFSGVVRRALRAVGVDAYSCDLEPAEDGGDHYQCDVREVLHLGWDLGIFHPPCTHLAVSGARWFKHKATEQAEALAFVAELLDAPIEKIALENPVSIISSRIRKPDQIIQPWQFGHGETKATCLWLKGLPPLVPTEIVDGRVARVHREPPSPERWKNRSRTYPGIAQAMAEQWGRPRRDYMAELEEQLVRVLGGSEQLPHQGKREMARRAKRLSEQLERELREAREDLK